MCPLVDGGTEGQFEVEDDDEEDDDDPVVGVRIVVLAGLAVIVG